MKISEEKPRKIPKDEDIVWTNRCYGYVRVSTIIQAETGMSIEIQKKKIHAWATMADHEIIEIFSDEGVSGTSFHGRLGLIKLMETIKRGETLIVLSFSRLARSTAGFLEITNILSERGCRLVVICEGFDTKTPYGRYAAIMFTAIAELESGIIQERVKESMKLKKEKGEFVGRPPYGWKLENGPGSNLVGVEEEQKIINYIRDMKRGIYSDGKELTYGVIAERLTKEGVKPSGKSKGWTFMSVKRIAERVNIITKGRSDNNSINQPNSNN